MKNTAYHCIKIGNDLVINYYLFLCFKTEFKTEVNTMF
jgi:hypothetical protein